MVAAIKPMTPDQFRAALADLGLSQAGFARKAMVNARTVRRWCDGTRAVPGPVVALLQIMNKPLDKPTQGL
jgi:DNA-binding transcriptional regulator YiaG